MKSDLEHRNIYLSIRRRNHDFGPGGENATNQFHGRNFKTLVFCCGWGFFVTKISHACTSTYIHTLYSGLIPTPLHASCQIESLEIWAQHFTNSEFSIRSGIVLLLDDAWRIMPCRNLIQGISRWIWGYFCFSFFYARPFSLHIFSTFLNDCGNGLGHHPKQMPQ